MKQNSHQKLTLWLSFSLLLLTGMKSPLWAQTFPTLYIEKASDNSTVSDGQSISQTETINLILDGGTLLEKYTLAESYNGGEFLPLSETYTGGTGRQTLVTLSAEVTPGSYQTGLYQYTIVDNFGNQSEPYTIFWGVSVCSAPSQSVSGISFGSATTNTLTINSMNPSADADGYAVYINSVNNFTSPSRGTEPDAELNYNGIGQQCIYYGTEVPSSVQVTGLNIMTSYYFKVYPYKDCYNVETYQSSGTSATDSTVPEAPSISAVSTQASVLSEGASTYYSGLIITGMAKAGEYIQLYNKNSEMQGRIAIADSDGNWSISLTVNGYSDYSFTTRVQESGEESLNSNAFTCTVLGPEITGFSPDTGTEGDGITNETLLTFNGTAKEGEIVQIFIADRYKGETTATGGVWSFEYDAVTSGTIRLKVKSLGVTTEDNYLITVDQNNPDAPSTPDLIAADDTGDYDNDNFTQGADSDSEGNLTPKPLTFTGTAAEAGTTVKLYQGFSFPKTKIGEGIVQDDKTWSITTEEALDEGFYLIDATVTDKAGNEGEASEGVVIVIDRSTSEDFLHHQAEQPGSGSGLSELYYTNSRTLQLEGDVETNSRVQLFVKSDTYAEELVTEFYVAGNGSWTYDFENELPANDTYTITMKAIDLAGNEAITTKQFRIDQIAPTPAAPDLVEADDKGTSNTDNLTNQITINLVGTMEGEYISEVKLYDDTDAEVGSYIAADDNVNDTNWSIQLAGLEGGTNDAPKIHKFRVKERDAAGNWSDYSDWLEVTIETQVPTVSMNLSEASDSYAVDENSDNRTRFTEVTLEGIAEPGAQVVVTGTRDHDASPAINYGTAVADATTGVWSISSISVEGYENGARNYYFVATVSDDAGNAQTSEQTVVVDQSAPSAPISLDLADESDSGDSAVDDLTNVSQPTITGRAEIDSYVDVLATGVTNGLITLGRVRTDINGDWSISSDDYIVGGLADDVYTITAQATDIAGNVSNQSEGLEIEINAVPPAGYTVSIEQEYINSENQNRISFSLSNAEIGTKYQYTISDGTNSIQGDLRSPLTESDILIEDLDVSSLNDGLITLSLTLTDNIGNVGTPATSTKRKDTVVSNFAVTINNGAEYINDAGKESVELNITNGELLAEINYTFTDERGNEKTDKTQLPLLMTSKTVSGIDLSALDDGLITVTASMTDVAGNTREGVIDEIIKDTQAPVYTTTIEDIHSDNYVNVVNQTNVGLVIDGAKVGDTYSYTFTDKDGAKVSSSDVITQDNQKLTGIDLSALANEGQVTLAVSLTDPAGNTGEEATDEATLDTNVPFKPTVAIKASSDTGNGEAGTDSDSKTMEVRPVFTGTANEGYEVEIYEGETKLGVATATAGDVWEASIDLDLSVGAHTLIVKAMNIAGNQSEDSDALNIVVDNEVGTLSIDLFADDNSGDKSDYLTNATAPKIMGDIEEDAKLEIYNNDALVQTLSKVTTGSWEFVFDGVNALADGTVNNIKLVAIDEAGNKKEDTSLSLLIDRTAPENTALVNLDSDTGNGVEGTDTDKRTSLDMPSVGGTVEAGVMVKVYIDAAADFAVGVMSDETTGVWSVTLPALANGEHTVKTVLTDKADNSSVEGEVLTIYVDLEAPSAVTDLNLDTDSDSKDNDAVLANISSDSDNITSIVTPKITGSAESLSKVTISLTGATGDTLLTTITLGESQTEWEYTLPQEQVLSEGIHTFKTHVIDNAGNEQTVADAELAIRVDTEAPAVAGLPNLTLASDTGYEMDIDDHFARHDDVTNVQRPTIEGMAVGSASSTVPQGEVPLGDAYFFVKIYDNGNYVDQVIADVDTKWEYTFAEDLTHGEHIITTKVVDRAGNESEVSEALTISIDIEKPQVIEGQQFFVKEISDNVDSEGSEAGQFVGVINGKDNRESNPDNDDALYKWAIVGGASDLFEIQPETGILSIHQDANSETFDRELIELQNENGDLEVFVSVVDIANNSSLSESGQGVLITITVEDVDENPVNKVNVVYGADDEVHNILEAFEPNLESLNKLATSRGDGEVTWKDGTLTWLDAHEEYDESIVAVTQSVNEFTFNFKNVGTTNVVFEIEDSNGEKHEKVYEITVEKAPLYVSVINGMKKVQGSVSFDLLQGEVTEEDINAHFFVWGYQNEDIQIIEAEAIIDADEMDEAGENAYNVVVSLSDINGELLNYELVFPNDDDVEITAENEVTFYNKFSIIEPGVIYMPNLFSPNGMGDEINERFFIMSDGHIDGINFNDSKSIKEVHLAIYDYRGSLMYETTDVEEATTKGWDGNVNGVEAPEGTYVWKLVGKLSDGTELSYNGKSTGEITLIR